MNLGTAFKATGPDGIIRVKLNDGSEIDGFLEERFEDDELSFLFRLVDKPQAYREVTESEILEINGHKIDHV
nr:hypothetical protein [uncultured Dethiosulfovibrio sp.]